MPNEPLALEHLRPISLTSCLGKLIVHTRLSNHVIDTEAFPHTMIGFRAGLSTQDVMLTRHHHVIRCSPDRLDSSAVLALDLTKAFDNVGHEAVLKGVQSITYNCINDFLSDCHTPPFSFVLSPLLFSLAILKIAKRFSPS